MRTQLLALASPPVPCDQEGPIPTRPGVSDCSGVRADAGVQGSGLDGDHCRVVDS